MTRRPWRCDWRALALLALNPLGAVVLAVARLRATWRWVTEARTPMREKAPREEGPTWAN